MENEDIVELNMSDEHEILDLLTLSFLGHQMMPSLRKKPECTKRMMKGLIDFNGGFKKATQFGIRKNDELVTCVTLADYSPSIYRLLKLAFLSTHLLGFKGLEEFWIYFKEMPKYEETYIKIALFATKPEHQQKGYGKKMLNYLYELARKRDCKGLILATNFETPAYKFYLKEGFTLEKEFDVNGMKSCWMRRII